MATIKMTNGNSTKNIDERLKQLYAKAGWKEVKSEQINQDYRYDLNGKK